MATTLRELLLSVKVKVDKDAVKQTDAAFDQAAASAKKFEGYSNRTLEPLKKVGAQLATNLKLAERIAAIKPAILPAGALPSSRAPEAPSDRKARELREALGMRDASHPAPPRPGQSLAAPDISAFMAPKAAEAAPDFRTGGQKALAAAREGLASLSRSAQVGMAQASAAVDRFNARFDGTIKAIFNARTAMAGFAIVVAGTAIGHFIGSVIEAGGALHDMAQRTRVGVETLQVWGAIATDAGVDAGSLEGIFRKLNKSMAAAGRGSKIQAASFKELGVSVKNADGSLRPIEDVLIDTGSALAGMEDDAKATAIATQLLGPAGMGLVPAFAGGADEIRKMSAELKENVALNAVEAARLDDVGDALTRGEKKWVALKTRAIVAILPLLEAVAKAFESGSKWILRMAKETSILQTIFLAITGGGLARLVTMFIAWVSTVGGARAALALFGQGLQTAAGFALRFIAPLLIIEDFLTFLAGGKSLFGRAFEEIFGAGGAKKTREDFLAFFEQLSAAAGNLSGALMGITGSGLFQGVATKALEAILALLNLIGLALADNTTKADAMAASLQGHLSKLGLAPTQEHVAQLNKDALPEDLGGAKRKPDAPEGWGAQFARKAMVAVLGDPTKSPEHKKWEEDRRAKIDKMRLDQQGIVPGPQAPPTPAAPVTINDQRKIEVNVGSGASPGETGRAVGSATSDALTKDRRQTLNAISG